MNLETVLNRNFTKMSDIYKQFATEKDACRKCSLYDAHKHVGQAEGNASSPTFMFIGEALGADEVDQKRPFIGRAGQRLRSELRKHPTTFTKETTLISNVLCCRPPNNVFPNDSAGPYSINDGRSKKTAFRKVKARELVHFCYMNWTEREISIVRPKVIVTIGAKALEFVRGDSGITQNRGSWKFIQRYRAWSIATYHPSYVLRCQNDESKEYVVEEFEQDIARIAKTWADIVNNDPRMSMSETEWDRERALNHAASIRLIKPEPLSSDGLDFGSDDPQQLYGSISAEMEID